MNKYIFALALFATAFITSCSDKEDKLLEPKVYFENKQHNVTLEGADEKMEINIAARVSNLVSNDVQVHYSIGDKASVERYNKRYGTNYEMFDVANAKLSKENAVIEKGELYAGQVTVELNKVANLQDGKTYILPIMLQSSSLPVIDQSDLEYIIIAKPTRITKVGTFTSNNISVKFPVNTIFKSFTYEALVYFNYFTGNSTIMGTEGLMILRVGDTGGGIAKDILQIAGGQHYEAPQGLQTNKWYHIALTYDQVSGKTFMYVNGVKWAESEWKLNGFNPNADVGFNIGKVAGFQWGERPLSGYMSEVRVWNVARTENQIKQNMLGVDPKTEGLALYYKLNGSEKVEGNTIIDAAQGIAGKTNGIQIKNLSEPIKVE